MPFPVSPNPGDSYTDAYGTVWIYAGSVNGWYRQQVSTPNDTSYTSAISGPAGSNTQVQFNDNGTLAGDSGLTFNKTTNALSGGAFIPTGSTAPTNGLYLSAANSVALSTNGQGRLFVDANGNVGVGAAPVVTFNGQTHLTVNHSTGGTTVAGINLATDGTRRASLITYPSNSEALRITAESTTLPITVHTNGSERLRITSTGLVGIGTSSPRVKLQVQGGDVANDVSVGTSSSTLEVVSDVVTNNGQDAAPGISFRAPYASALPAERTSYAAIWSKKESASQGNQLGALVIGTNSGSGTGVTEKMRITSAGNVGIGTTSPTSLLDVRATSGNVDTYIGVGDVSLARIRVGYQGAGFAGTADGGAVTTDSLGSVNLATRSGIANNIAFATSTGTGAATEKARIDSSGRLLVGTSTSTNNVRLGAKLAVVGTTDFQGAVFTTYSNTAADRGSFLDLCRSKGTTDGSLTAVAANDALGYVTFRGTDGAKFVDGALIKAEVDGIPGVDDMPGRLVFSTTADGAASPTERMRISQTGMCSINTTLAETSAYFDGKLRVLNSGTGASFGTTGASGALVVSQWHQATTGDNFFTAFGTEAAFTLRGSIDYNRAAGQVRYNVTSDRRLKSDIQPAASALDTLSAIQVRAYKWTETDYQVSHGFIAQELHESVPDAVKVGDSDEEVTNPWAVDNAKLVPLLTKALQEALAKIESLEARLDAANL